MGLSDQVAVLSARSRSPSCASISTSSRSIGSARSATPPASCPSWPPTSRGPATRTCPRPTTAPPRSGWSPGPRPDPDDAALAEEAARQVELAAAYEAYEGLLRAADRIDFGDQVGLALQLLRDHPDVLAAERSRYRYVLVDEFQDTNHAQFELVRLLAPAPSGNVTVVGDDDQSIYRFRGAALSNILGFRAAYRRTGRVVLTDNFRSPQPILDAAYRLIRHNDPDRLEVRERIDKHLRARGPTGPARDGQVTSLAFGTTSDEADGIADRIAASVAAGRRPGDHAILVRGNRDADPYLRALSLRRIPWRFSGTAGLYRQPEVRVLLSVLRALNDADDSVSLFDVATSEIFGLAPDEASRALNRASRRHMPLEAALREGLADPARATLRGPAAARSPSGCWRRSTPIGSWPRASRRGRSSTAS